MRTEEQERLYRDAMAARRAGEVCPLCGFAHAALSQCPPRTVPADEARQLDPDAANRAAWNADHERRAAFNTHPNTPPLVRTTDVETSHAAAAAGDKPALRLICLGLYAENPEGLVDDDLGRLAGWPGHESYRRRGSDLRALGWTEWLMETVPAVDAHVGTSERPVRRRTHLGSTARVAVITPLGRSTWDAR